MEMKSLKARIMLAELDPVSKAYQNQRMGISPDLSPQALY